MGGQDVGVSPNPDESVYKELNSLKKELRAERKKRRSLESELTSKTKVHGKMDTSYSPRSTVSSTASSSQAGMVKNMEKTWKTPYADERWLPPYMNNDRVQGKQMAGTVCSKRTPSGGFFMR